MNSHISSFIIIVFLSLTEGKMIVLTDCMDDVEGHQFLLLLLS
jgi:hypothetical protein